LTPSILDWAAVQRPPELEDRPALEETANDPILADYRSYFAEDQRSFNQRMRTRYPALAARVSHRHALYCDSHKLIVSPSGDTQFFDLAADPSEQRDLAADATDRWKACRASYREQLRAGVFTPFASTAPGSSLKEEDLERLRSLGYLQ
jgi:arylsulfatase A-like enzyme